MIDVLKLLTYLGIEYHNAGTDNVKIKCINPEHDDSRPSFYIHKELGIGHCFVCGFASNIFTLLHSKGIYGIDAINYLAQFSKGGTTEEEITAELEKHVKSRSKNKIEHTEIVGDIILPQHRVIDSNPYLEGRGITREEIIKWRMAVVTAGRNIGWILIPIYQEGIIRNYFLRSAFGSGKLYGSYPRHDLLAGLDFCTDYRSPIYVAEGIFKAIAMARTGNQCVAALGNQLLDGQIKKLKKFKQVIIVPDNDKGGVQLIRSAFSLVHNLDLQVCQLPDNRKDADVCTLDELLNATDHLIPIGNYISKFVLQSAQVGYAWN